MLEVSTKVTETRQCQNGERRGWLVGDGRDGGVDVDPVLPLELGPHAPELGRDK